MIRNLQNNPSKATHLNEWKLTVINFIEENVNAILEKRNTVRKKKRETPQVFDVKFTKETSKTMHGKKIRNTQQVCVCLYFVRKTLKFPIEIWTFSIDYTEDLNSKHRIIALKKRLEVLSRTVGFLLRFLPGFTLFNKQGFMFELVTSVLPNKDQFEHHAVYKENKKSFKDTCFGRFCDNVGGINLEVLYADISEIYKIEEEIVRNRNKFKLKNYAAGQVTMRKRFLSENKDFNYCLVEKSELIPGDDPEVRQTVMLDEVAGLRPQPITKGIHKKRTSVTTNAITETGVILSSLSQHSPNRDQFFKRLNNEDIQAKSDTINFLRNKLKYLNCIESRSDSGFSFDDEAGFSEDSMSFSSSDLELRFDEKEAYNQANTQNSYISIRASLQQEAESQRVNPEQIIKKFKSMQKRLNKDKMILNLQQLVKSTKLFS